jgi:hypothetical protein
MMYHPFPERFDGTTSANMQSLAITIYMRGFNELWCPAQA